MVVNKSGWYALTCLSVLSRKVGTESIEREEMDRTQRVWAADREEGEGPEGARQRT